jgi:hypothetical protein
VGFQAVKGNIMDRIFIRRREYKEWSLWRARIHVPVWGTDNKGWNKDHSRKNGSQVWGQPMRVPDTLVRSRDWGRAWKRSRNQRGSGEAT